MGQVGGKVALQKADRSCWLWDIHPCWDSLTPHLMISSKLCREGQNAQPTLLRVSPKTFSLFLKTSLSLPGLLAKIKCKNLLFNFLSPRSN